MNKYFILFYCLITPFCFAMEKDQDNAKDHIQAMVLLSAYGDVLGRLTEHTKIFKSETMTNTRKEFDSLQKLFSNYPTGIKNMADVASNTFYDGDDKNYKSQLIPTSFKEKKCFPYTDDTAMAILVAKALLQNPNNDISCNDLMNKITQNFLKELDPTKASLGWAARFRVPGSATLSALQEIEKIDKASSGTYWDLSNTKDHKSGGAGALMRVYPIGIFFRDDSEKALEYAVAQSKITHPHPWSHAACAVMMVAIVNGLKTVDKLPEKNMIEEMKAAADNYDNGTSINLGTKKPNSEKTSQKIDYAYLTGKRMKKKLEEIGDLSLQDLINQLSSFDENVLNNSIDNIHNDITTRYAGWVADDCLAAALYCVAASGKDPLVALMLAVHTPGDSDTIAAVTGALFGALYGYGTIKLKDKNGSVLTRDYLEQEFQQIENYEKLKKIAECLADYSEFVDEDDKEIVTENNHNNDDEGKIEEQKKELQSGTGQAENNTDKEKKVEKGGDGMFTKIGKLLAKPFVFLFNAIKSFLYLFNG